MQRGPTTGPCVTRRVFVAGGRRQLRHASLRRSAVSKVANPLEFSGQAGVDGARVGRILAEPTDVRHLSGEIRRRWASERPFFGGMPRAGSPAMFQLVARAPMGRLLFRTHVEARALWACITEAFPEALSLILMPNHLHLDTPHPDPDDRLSDAMRAFARWRNHHRDESGEVWEPHPPAVEPADEQHARRLRRYTLLNPVRAHLCKDPLEWPWSLHRELVGFGFTPGFSAHPKPNKFHDYVSRDKDSNPNGSMLPVGCFNAVKLGEIIDAVCGVTRSFANEVLLRGRPRTLVLRTAWAHEICDTGLLAAAVGCTPRAVRTAVVGTPSRGGRFEDPELAACVRAVDDARFTSLEHGDLRKSLGWSKSIYVQMW